MKTTTLTTAADRAARERTSMSEAVRRAMCRIASERMGAIDNARRRRGICRDALHAL
jgi:hypothetical protein